MTNRILIFASIVFLSGCATQVKLPSNVTISKPDSWGNKFINNVSFSYPTNPDTNFTKLKTCLAENISNDGVILTDTSNSFVGEHTGNYYKIESSKYASGHELFKYIDDNSRTAIVKGTTIANSTFAFVPITDYVRYELKVSLNNNQLNMIFYNLTSAQKDTGVVNNDGFNPVGAWKGSRAKEIYQSLVEEGDRIDYCLNQS